MRCADSPPVVLDPRCVWSLELPQLEGRWRRLTLRALLAASAGTVRVEGAERLVAAPRPSIFALSHHNLWEAVLAPSALIALRGGRLVRFLADWMYVDLPWTGWLVRQARPIPVYSKRARAGLRDGHRRAAERRGSAIDRAVAALAAGEDVGIYPEGRRNADPHRLLRGRRGLGRLALRSGAPVVPVGVDFAARDRILRTPRAGRFVLRVGEPLDFTAAHAEWRAASGEAARRGVERRLGPYLVDAVQREVARLSRKYYLPAGNATGGGARPAALAPAIDVSDGVTTARITSESDRRDGLSVLAEVYTAEKGWLADVDAEIPPGAAADAGQSWFLARVGRAPAGVLRVAYDPPLELPAEAEVELEPGVDLGALARAGRFVEVGRLTVRPAFRGRPAVVLDLIRAAVEEIRRRSYTHLLTAVFEDDPHSPYGFHTRVLGFERIGTHRRGELRCASRRILLVLDLDRAVRRLSARRGSRLARLTAGALARDEAESQAAAWIPAAPPAAAGSRAAEAGR
jgi:1-acyl-sn-glycerol-3-phosphate acyltransferase